MLQKILGTIDKNARIDQKRPYVSGGITLGLVLALGIGMWVVYPKDQISQGGVAAPIIRADATPYKTVPEDPGGMEIPHRDSTVFKTLKSANAGNSADEAEQLLPESEEPMERDEIFARIEKKVEEEFSAPETPRVVSKTKQEHEVIKPKIPEEILAKIEKGEIVVKGVKTASSAGPVETAMKEDVAGDKASVTSKPIKISVSGGDGAKKEIVLNNTQKVAAGSENSFDSFEPESSVKKMTAEPDDADSMAKTEPAAGPIVAETINVDKNFYVQLGSVQDDMDAVKEWKRLKKVHGDSLSGLDYRVERADLGARGVYYRIQGGPVTAGQARDICENISQKKPGACIVIKP